jgi:hypothetical protein
MENVKGDSVVESLILDLLEWLAKRERTYEEAMDAWMPMAWFPSGRGTARCARSLSAHCRTSSFCIA